MSGWIERLMPHLMLAPIMLPMLTAAMMLTLGEKQSNQWGINFDDLVYKNSSEAQASFSISQ